MKTLEQVVEKVTDIMVSDFQNGCDDYDRPSGLHLVAFVYDVDLGALRQRVKDLFHEKLAKQ